MTIFVLNRMVVSIHAWSYEGLVKAHFCNSYVNFKSEYSGALCNRALAWLGFKVG